MKLRDKAKLGFQNMKRNVFNWEYYKSLRNLISTSIINKKEAYFAYKTNNATTKHL